MQFAFVACLFAVFIIILIYRAEIMALLTTMPKDLEITLAFCGCMLLVFIIYCTAFSLYDWYKVRRNGGSA